MHLTTFADRIVYALKATQHSRADLARAVNVSRTAITNWCTGDTKSVRPVNLFKAADFLGVNPRWLATGQGDPWEEDYSRILASLPEDQREHARAVLQAMEQRARYSTE